PSPEAFHAVADAAFRERYRGGELGTRSSPGAGDPDPRQIVRYAAGRARGDERAALETFVAQSTWARERVVALVRAKRPDAPLLAHALARRLLDPSFESVSQSKKASSPATLVASAVLEAECGGGDPGASGRFDEAWRRLEKSGN